MSRHLLIAIILVAIALRFGSPPPPPPVGCEVVAVEADLAPTVPDVIAGADYSHGTWSRSGQVVGFSRHEDSTVYDRRLCADTRPPYTHTHGGNP